jgi:hypothetical protein
MGCHPSHWLTHIFQDGYCTTNQLSIIIIHHNYGKSPFSMGKSLPVIWGYTTQPGFGMNLGMNFWVSPWMCYFQWFKWPKCCRPPKVQQIVALSPDRVAEDGPEVRGEVQLLDRGAPVSTLWERCSYGHLPVITGYFYGVFLVLITNKWP